MSARIVTALVVLACGAFLVAGCAAGSGKDDTAGTKPDAEKGKDPVAGMLVVDGRVRGVDDLTKPARRKVRTAPQEPAPRELVVEDEWPAPPLNADGTIDDGDDPFAASFVPVPAMPIEDDPYATSAVADAAKQLQSIDVERWDAWMEDGVGSPFQQRTDPIAASLVEVTVERCGGAEQVATGSVLADETVVTTATAVENAARRVRVGPANGPGPRIAAMVRYLDVDDDVAVLKVPGLQAEPLGWHDPRGTQPTFGYAYGVAPGGRSGTLRRVPVVATQEERSITVEQDDAFAKQITDRSVQTVVGAVTSGFQGGVVMATNDERMRGGWGFHGMLRARMGLRSQTAGIVVPTQVVAEDLDASDLLPEWFEIKPGGCPQWHR